MNRVKYSFILLLFSCFLIIPLISNASIVTYFGSGTYNAYSSTGVVIKNMNVIVNINDQVLDLWDNNPGAGAYRYDIDSWYFIGDSQTGVIDYGTRGYLPFYDSVQNDGKILYYSDPFDTIFQSDITNLSYWGPTFFLEEFNLPLTGPLSFNLGYDNYTDYISIPGIEFKYTRAYFTVDRYAPVPEPSTMLLLGSGLVGLVGYGRKRFKK